MKILTILGARPQFIKAATVSRAIRAHDGIREIIAHTGQHFDANMSDVFFDQLDILHPDNHLGNASLSHGDMTGRMLEGIETLIQQEQPPTGYSSTATPIPPLSYRSVPALAQLNLSQGLW